jgi:hypothetical protein
MTKLDVLMTNADDNYGSDRESIERSAARDRQLARRGGIANRQVSRRRLLSRLSAGRRRVNHLRTFRRIGVILGGGFERPLEIGTGVNAALAAAFKTP